MSSPDSIDYDFSAPARVVFGWGRRVELGSLARTLGQRAFVICGSRTLSRSPQWHELLQFLTDAGLESHCLSSFGREPIVEDVDRLVSELRTLNAGPGDLLVGIGGGSAIDLAKATAALIPQESSASVRDYLEGVGRGLKIIVPPLPLLALPTTGGTGSEATKNAVISSFDPPFKKSLRSEGMVPRIVLIDPELSIGVPPHITASTGMDALTQLLESFISRRATEFTRVISGSGLRLILPHLINAHRQGASRPAREALAQAAFLSGLALANSGLGMAHGVAAALGVHCHVAHGLACAVMLPATLRANRRDPVVEGLLAQAAFDLLAQEDLTDAERTVTRPSPQRTALDGNVSQAVDRLVARVDQLLEDLGIPRRLSQLGVTRAQIPLLVRDSRGNSMNGNPRTIADDELTTILEEIL